MKKTTMKCLVGISMFMCGTVSFADSSKVLHDTNGNVLKTDKMYCVRPIGIEPKVDLTVDDNRYVKISDNSIDCQYAYKLVGDDRVKNRTVAAGETISFEEVKKEIDSTYRKTNNFLKVNSNRYIDSTVNDYIIVVEGTNFPSFKRSYEFSRFSLVATTNNNSALQVKYNKSDEIYLWKVPYTIEGGEQWLELQNQNNATGITTFEFEPVQ